MIESTSVEQKHDRLAAFLKAFPLTAKRCDSAQAANLLIIDSHSSGSPTHLLYRARSVRPLPDGAILCAAASVNFGGMGNPLLRALPDELSFSLKDEPKLRGLAELMVAEAERAQCGGGTIEARLSEVAVVLAVRKAIAKGTVDGGMLAGLAHPKLHLTLVEIHDDPARKWKIANLAAVAGMSRGQFIAAFKTTVGQSPIAYLNGWRLAVGRAEMLGGRSVKGTASAVGFGSAAAFSRAYFRKYGSSPKFNKSCVEAR